MNRTFLQYVTALKMEEAKLRLRHSRSRVQDVARDLGYEDVVYFAKLFRRATGQSPSEYKNGLRMNG
ncbi:helix-turn-helix transcriptional regulator [Cohnella rhizosphaerae]|uniref:Helix-turn-helix transcriptional regulator n=1 Tax=Cohnella rhizosphaerae TaxID=1457232 RepID=A0A9X4KYY7_9BACL|nr:helix-turn-helix transcriptional regulator [Cohnella rhizosphaerae]MDG0813333.1 helix-turn-helix transcriptional regulator [Cohnella rhizosphaerae]